MGKCPPTELHQKILRTDTVNKVMRHKINAQKLVFLYTKN